jgi:hypothetical protein
MSDESPELRNRAELAVSFFPDAEAPSYCSRPTPVVPPSDDLRSFGREASDVDGSGLIATPSSRPTAGPGELEPVMAIASDRPTFAPDQVLAEMIERATIGTPIPPPDVTPPTVTPPTATSTSMVVPRRGRGRAWGAYALFTVLFSGVLALLGYALRPTLGHAVDVVRGRVAPPSATR